jgi:hypothetical protein
LFTSKRGSLSLNLHQGEEIEHNPINIDELFILEDTILEETMVGASSPIKIKVGRSSSPLVRDHEELTP